MQKKLFIKSFGCQMNEYDSAKIIELLAASYNLAITATPTEADLIVLNTCSVRDKAAEKVFSDLGRLRPLKKNNPNLILAVGGCVSMLEQKNIFKRAPYVDIVFGPQTLHRLPQLYARALNQERRIIDTSFPETKKFDYLPPPSAIGSIAYVSIIEGCNKFCSYCVVPYTRGIEVSRSIQEILTEIKVLAGNGAREIHLLGQTVNAYRDADKNLALAQLIHAIAEIETIARIRFTTSHPTEFTDELIATFANVPKLVNHIHLPIQSGSNRILKLMRRGYTLEEYQLIIDKLRKIRPTISISTDFIVGFPTETAKDFAATLTAAQNLNFDGSYSFIYSPRPKTLAAKMADDIPLPEKKQRLAILQNQLAMQSRQHSKNMLSTSQKILVTGHASTNPQQFSGKTENNRTINFIAPPNILGKIVEVKVIEVLANSLRGELLAT